MLRLLAVTAILLCFSKGNAQQIDYLENNPIWVDYSQNYYNATNTAYKVTNQYYLDGEEIIGIPDENNDTIMQTFKKLFVNSQKEDNGWLGNINPPTYTYDGGHIGYIRQDGKKLYFRFVQHQIFLDTYWNTSNSGTHHEYLLYDFGLQVGDTLPSTLFLDNQYSHSVVTEIDSFLVDGVFRKLLKTNFQVFAFNPYANYPNYYTLIEGIGSYQGFLKLIGGMCCWSAMVCYEYNSIPVLPVKNYYWDIDYGCGIYSIEEQQKLSNLKLYPNPASEQVWLSVDIDLQIDKIVLLDMTGRELKVNYTFEHERINLNTSHLSAGIYLVQVQLKSGNSGSVKLIIE